MTDDLEHVRKVVEQENVSRGVTIVAKLKRGIEPRDQDEIRIKAKGKTAREATEQMERVINHAETWADDLRAIQPDPDDGGT